ncbi:MAG: hypothetical protein M1828_005453 [Chrysothrix sp. TS-e1954]|nr:MAG: hypothetical protein M1828_005453 [Chrysothrix sp. TS-e1954]
MAEAGSPLPSESLLSKTDDSAPASPSFDTTPSIKDSSTSQSPPPLHGLNNAALRRIPRKSTLTQQQKNQKRQRATQDQLTMLEVEFNKNPTPTAMVRERIAGDINMTERSVQIWFQNRRAKIKNLAKKSIETGEDCDVIPESMRKYLAFQALESGKPLSREALAAKALNPFGHGLMMSADSQAKVSCRSLSIGTWKRISQTALDLVVFYSPAKSMFTYYINAESSGFKIEYPFSSIKSISLDTGDMSSNAEGAVQGSGGLVVELSEAPHFSMDPGSGGFLQCRDFTENQQASQVLTHHLGGHSKVLAGQLAKLVSLECFRNRHFAHDSSAITVSAPVSPIGGRPSSQPNHLLHPHMNPGQESTFGMGPPPSRLGHKRQRSRSVPVGCDVSQFRRPMPPFMQHDMSHQMHLTPAYHHQHIFAPTPHHVPPPPPLTAPITANGFAPFNPSLNINVSAANFDFDFHNGPMSATTINSTDAEPSYFTAPITSDNYSTSQMNTPYGAPFISPMMNFINTPASPYTSIGHGDPVIANHSPPMASYDHRSASADMFSSNQNEAVLTDEGMSFNDMYPKQPFSLPFRSPVAETVPEPNFDFENMVHFNGPESESLSPDSKRFSNGT